MEFKKQRTTSPGATSSSSRSRKISDEEAKISALIVDDDHIIRLIHKALLEGFCNIEAKMVKDGKEAVDLYRSGANFDVIFMDKEMPIMDGVEATRKLRAMGVKGMIVGVTSRVDGPEREEFLTAGLNQCFEKPLSRDMIEAVLEKLQK